jgi:hypothetical protein
MLEDMSKTLFVNQSRRSSEWGTRSIRGSNEVFEGLFILEHISKEPILNTDTALNVE